MKKIAILMVLVFVMSLAAYAGPFSDVPFGHWAYDAVSKLVSKGILKGYPDNTFKGGKNVTRYEVAMIVARMMGEIKGGAAVDSGDLATLEKLTVEFSDELALLGVKVTALEDDARATKRDISMIKSELSEVRRSGGNGLGKVNISGDYTLKLNLQKYDNDSSRHAMNNAIGDDTVTAHGMGLNIFTNIDENVSAFARYLVQGRWSQMDQQSLGNLQYAYIDIDNLWKIGDLRLGRQNVVLGHGIVVADQMDGIRFDKVIDRVKLSAMAMDHKEDFNGTMTYYPYNADGVLADLAVANTAGVAATDDITFYVSPYSWPNPTTSDVDGNGTLDNAWAGVALDIESAVTATPAFTNIVNYDYETDVAFLNAIVANNMYLLGSSEDEWSLGVRVGSGGAVASDIDADGTSDIARDGLVAAANNDIPVIIDQDNSGTITAGDTPYWLNTTGLNPTRSFVGLIDARIDGDLEAEDAAAVALAEQNLQERTITDYLGNTYVYDRAGFTKNWAMTNDRGFNFMAVAVSVDVGGHRLGAYYASNKYSAYDPYTRLGDPFAAVTDIDADGNIDAADFEAPAARPSWMGLTLDGNILKNLDYFLEYVSFDPDIENVGMHADNILDADWDNATSIAGDEEPWANNLKKGKAWLLGIDWDITEKYNLIASYGEGSEEFVALAIDPALQFNGMEGRWNAGMMEVADTRYYADPSSSLGLAGVKDILVKFNAIFNDTTEGYISYENVSDNDNDQIRTIAGPQATTGHPVMDYSIITLNVKHQYRPNTSFGLSYTRVNYSEAVVDQLQNAGSWDRIRAEVEVRF